MAWMVSLAPDQFNANTAAKAAMRQAVAAVKRNKWNTDCAR
jgi:hypothetical protein